MQLFNINTQSSSFSCTFYEASQAIINSFVWIPFSRLLKWAHTHTFALKGRNNTIQLLFSHFYYFRKINTFLSAKAVRKRKHCCIFCMRLTLWQSTFWQQKQHRHTNLIKYPKSLLFDFIKILTRFSEKYFIEVSYCGRKWMLQQWKRVKDWKDIKNIQIYVVIKLGPFCVCL